MPKISKFFNLGKTQPELDFVDIDTGRDTHLYVDPYAIEIRNDELSDELKYYIVKMCSSLLIMHEGILD